MRLLIFGPQGAGKGTQAALLSNNLQVPHVSTGDIFRANLSTGTPLGLQAKKYMDRGELVPDAITRAMVADRLAEADAVVGFLLDGFPRNISQAIWFNALLDERRHELDAVLMLVAPDEVLIERMLLRGRADDTTAAISRRLAIYHEETLPLLDLYRDKVIEVDGIGEIEEVQDRILSALGHRELIRGKSAAVGHRA